MSVHSQADAEQADLALERTELKIDDLGEHKELTAIYVDRGLDPALAKRVADQLMAHDAIGAHARDELGISETFTARPIQGCACVGRQLRCWSSDAPLDRSLVPETALIPVVSGTSLVFLALLGGLAARVGGARVTVGAMRVTLWGALAMGLTAGVGALEPRERNGALKYGSIGLLGFKRRASQFFFTICPILDRNLVGIG